MILDRTGDENDALLEKARINVVCAFTAVGLLHNHGNQIHCKINRIRHCTFLLKTKVVIHSEMIARQLHHLSSFFPTDMPANPRLLHIPVAQTRIILTPCRDIYLLHGIAAM